jgi:hypothetical protein
MDIDTYYNDYMFCNHYVLQYSTVGQNGNNNFVIFHSGLKDTIIVYCNIPHWATKYIPYMLRNDIIICYKNPQSTDVDIN